MSGASLPVRSANFVPANMVSRAAYSGCLHHALVFMKECAYVPAHHCGITPESMQDESYAVVAYAL